MAERPRAASQAWSVRMPSERSLLKAMYELIVTGKWLQANTRYDDYPDEKSEDVSDFVDVQVNVGLLAALMLTILADMLFNYAGARSLLEALLTCLIWTSTLLYFTSCTWSVFNIMCVTQSDTPEEGNIVLLSMGWRAAMPVRLWVYGSLNIGGTFLLWFVNLVYNVDSDEDDVFHSNVTDHEVIVSKWLVVVTGCGEVLVTAAYLIYCVSRNVQLVYKCKRIYKTRMNAIIDPLRSDPVALSAALKTEIVVTAPEMAADLKQFAAHVGWEYLSLDRFLRFLFNKHRPANVSQDEEVHCQFADVTRERAKLFFEKLINEKLESEYVESVTQSS